MTKKEELRWIQVYIYIWQERSILFTATKNWQIPVSKSNLRVYSKISSRAEAELSSILNLLATCLPHGMWTIPPSFRLQQWAQRYLLRSPPTSTLDAITLQRRSVKSLCSTSQTQTPPRAGLEHPHGISCWEGAPSSCVVMGTADSSGV